MKICFFGNVSSALKGRTPGGGELQICLLAKALALKGHEVIVVDPYSSESFVTPEGIQLIHVPEWNKGVKGLRMFMYRIPALLKAFSKLNADYYYVRMRVFLNILPFIVAKRKKKKFIQAIAHDLDVLSITDKIKHEYKTNFNLFRFLTEHLPNDIIFKFLLHQSDFITLQHTGQKFASKHGKSKQVLFPNLICTNNFPDIKSPSKDYFICVGSFTILKGADRLQQLINIVDERIKIMIVGQPKGEKAKEIYNALSKKQNVVLKGRLSHLEAINLIANAKALINTSHFEGFPNIFLEAWGAGVPVVSLNVNPGNIFNTHRLGIYCNDDLDRMKRCIESNEMEQFHSEELKEYVGKFHDFKNAADRFVQTISL
jgi:glycosyltransferase involved in cell wall biosynthesis